MKKLRKSFSALIAVTAVLLSILLLLPLLYGGTSPTERLLRLNDGGNVCRTITDSVAIALACKSGIFDICKDGKNGVFIYRLQDENNTAEAYWQLDRGNNQTAEYILIKDGVRYQFSMDENGWQFANSRVCLTDFNRLAKNTALILTNKKTDTQALLTDLNGITGLDLSKYINFEALPAVIRSLVKSCPEKDFQQATGYSFARENFTLRYNFAPAESKQLADYLHTLIKPAYTKNTQSIVNIAGIAGGLADLIGFDLYDLLFNGNLSFSVGAFSGKLIKFTYTNDDTTLAVTNREYSGCRISIESEQLNALLAKHIV